jgi:hypothetical protein
MHPGESTVQNRKLTHSCRESTAARGGSIVECELATLLSSGRTQRLSVWRACSHGGLVGPGNHTASRATRVPIASPSAPSLVVRTQTSPPLTHPTRARAPAAESVNPPTSAGLLETTNELLEHARRTLAAIVEDLGAKRRTVFAGCGDRKRGDASSSQGCSKIPL